MFIVIIALSLAVAFPVAWLAAEFQPRRWPRIALGCCSIGASFLIALAVGSLEHLNANAWYGGASQRLIDATIHELESGNTERVVEELRTLQSEFHPSYENRARYDGLVDDYVSRLGRDPADSI